MNPNQSRRAIVAIACALVSPSAHNAIARPAPIDPCSLLAADQVKAVGDDAFYTLLGPYAPLAVKKGATIFIVKIFGVAEPDKQEEYEKTLALDVVKHL